MTDGCFLGCRAVGALLRTVEKVDDARLREVLRDKGICAAVPSGRAPALTTVQRFANAVENFALMELCTVLTKADVAAIARAHARGRGCTRGRGRARGRGRGCGRASSRGSRRKGSTKGSRRVHEMVLGMGLDAFLKWAPAATIKSVAAALGLTAVEGCSDEWFGTLEARHAVADELTMVGLMRLLLALGEERLRLFCRLIHTRVLRVATRESIIDHAMRVVFELVCDWSLFLWGGRGKGDSDVVCVVLQRPVKRSSNGRDDSGESDSDDEEESSDNESQSSGDGDSNEDGDDAKSDESDDKAPPAKRTRSSTARSPSKSDAKSPARKGRVSPARKRSVR